MADQLAALFGNSSVTLGPFKKYGNEIEKDD